MAKQLELDFNAAPEPVSASVVPFPSCRNRRHVRVVAEELAALPAAERSRAWAKHSRRLVRRGAAAGIPMEAVLADGREFMRAIKLLIKYLETDPTRAAKGSGGNGEAAR